MSETSSNRTLRIAINATSASSQWTGIGQYTKSLLAAIGADPGPHQWLLLSPSGPPVLEAAQVRTLSVDPRPFAWDQLHLPSLLSDYHIDVYHNPAFGLPIVKPCPCICTVHDCIPRLFPDLVPSGWRRFFEEWAERWVRLADHLICVSEHTKHDFVHLYGADPDRCTVIYQTVPDYFRPLEDETLIEAVKAKYGVEKPYVLCVGRVELRKNVPRLMRAFERLQAQEGRHWQLVLAGPKDADAQDPRGELPGVGRVGDVIVTGFVPEEDLVALYNGAVCLCFPSLYEGFGRPVLEAMQCGTPVITSRVSSLPEIAGDAALYVNPHDDDSVAAALAQLLGDEALRGTMQDEGLARARKFSREKQGRQLTQTYERATRVG